MTRSYDQDCPIARTLDAIGDRWTLLILRDMFFGRTKYSELRDHSPGMPARLLAARLQTLTARGFIERRIYSQHPLRADYHLTDRGLSLAPVLEAMANWGLEHEFTRAERTPMKKRIARGIADGPARRGAWRSDWAKTAYARPAKTKVAAGRG